MKTLRLLPLFVIGLLTGVQAASASPRVSTSRPSSPPSVSGGIATAALASVAASSASPAAGSGSANSANSPRPSIKPSGDLRSDPRGALRSEPQGYGEVEWIRTPRPQAQWNRPEGSVPDAVQDQALEALRSEAPTEWTVELSDRTFRQTLLRWTRIANWQLVWEVDRDFAIDAQVTLNGNFLEALNQAMASLRDTDYPVQARVNPDTRVLRVVRYMLDGERR